MDETLMQIPASEQEVIDKLNERNSDLNLVRVDSDIDIDNILQDPKLKNIRKTAIDYPQSYLVVNGHIVKLKIMTMNSRDVCIANLIENLPELRILTLLNPNIINLIKNIKNLKHLVILNIFGDLLFSIPESIGDLINLKILGVSGTNLHSVPETIGNIINLEILALNRNNLNSLPESIGHLVKLTKLDISNNNLTSLPESIGNLSKLTELYISDNNLNSLPESIGNLSKLTELYISYNNLNSLPESFGNLSKLTKLYISYNNLTRLPESFLNLKCNEILLNRNPLRSLSNINFDNFLSYYSFPIKYLTTKGRDLLRPFDWPDGEYVSYDEAVDEDEDLYKIERDLKSVAIYYKHSSLVLAKKYCDEPKTLSPDELERLAWESGPMERDLLESRFPPENEVIKKINSRMKVELRNGYNIIL
jgi:Leucine-rich repeat (LRR) protein